jgi:predicted methyltransferase
MDPVLSHIQVAPLREAFRGGPTVVPLSLDLGRTVSAVELVAEGVRLPRDELLDWGTIDSISRSPKACFRVRDGTAQPIRSYSPRTARLYSLMPTSRAPTMLLSGIQMHRVKGTDPMADTESKIRAVAPVRGRVLDTTTGLGYTAIAAARTADQVITVELDPAVLEIAAQNPWSQELFTAPGIERRGGDVADLIQALPDASFDRIVHDPPMMSLAGDLYSGAFYRELRRVLRPGGRLFHYVGRPDSASGARVGKGVVKRLREAGFRRVEERPDAFGYAASP